MATVRPETPEDVKEIRRVNELAFGRPAEADLVEALRDSGKAMLSLVAIEDNRVVGHILLSPVTIESGDLRSDNLAVRRGSARPGVGRGTRHRQAGSLSDDESFSAVGLGPMAVLPERQRSCIGSALVQTALYWSCKTGHDCMVVLGHSKYYPRFGFVPASRFGLRCEYDVPDEVFMAIELRDGALKGYEGLVRYQPEFNEV